MKDFKNKVVTITGAGSGMGREYALQFGKLGAKLALNDWHEENLIETHKLAQEQGAKDIFIKAFDVSKKEELYTFADEVKATLGNTHVIINNAGISGNGDPFYNGDQEVFQKVLDINLFGVIHGCRAFLPQLLENNEGAVVNVASVFGLVGMPGVSAYCTTKFAVRGFTQSLMVEFHKSPISIHCVMPGGIDTAIADSAPNSEEFKKSLKTPPGDTVRYVIKCIKNGKQGIVHGHGSSALKFVSKFIPLKLKNKLIWNRMIQIDGGEDYRSFNSLMK